jgi:hypothetical protein
LGIILVQPQPRATTVLALRYQFLLHTKPALTLGPLE